MGTDVARSVRIPALCNGIYGFKPNQWANSFRWPVIRRHGGCPSCPTISAGPMANKLDDISPLFMSTVLGAGAGPRRYDATAHAMPWREEGGRQRVAPSAASTPGHEIVRLTNDENRRLSYGNRLAFQYFVYGPRKDSISPGWEPRHQVSVAEASSPMFTGPLSVSQGLDLYDETKQLEACSGQVQGRVASSLG